MKTKTIYLALLMFSVAVLFTGCSTSKENKTMPKNPISKPAIAPGTVSVTAKILKVSEVDGKFISNVRIIKVNEYGMNTKPVAKGSEIKLEVGDNLKSEIKNNKLFAIGKTALMLLKQQKEGLGITPSQNWKLINIK